MPIGSRNKLEKYVGATLTTLLVVGFFILAIEVQINGLQLVVVSDLNMN